VLPPLYDLPLPEKEREDLPPPPSDLPPPPELPPPPKDRAISFVLLEC
jgi:hypothetical protein